MTTPLGELRLRPQSLRSHPDVLCLDGSPGVYYVDLPPKIKKEQDLNLNKTTEFSWDKVLFYLEGGGWCVSPKDCWRRSKTYLGTSVGLGQYPPWPPWPRGEPEHPGDGTNTTNSNDTESDSNTDQPGLYPPPMVSEKQIQHQGIFNIDLFNDFAIVFLHYCDGNSFSGDREEPFIYENNQSDLNQEDKVALFNQLADYGSALSGGKGRDLNRGIIVSNNTSESNGNSIQSSNLESDSLLEDSSDDSETSQDQQIFRHKLYFRGKRILDAVIKDLDQRFSMLSKVENFILTGSSAGGLSTLINADRIKEDIFGCSEISKKSQKISDIDDYNDDDDDDDRSSLSLSNFKEWKNENTDQILIENSNDTKRTRIASETSSQTYSFRCSNAPQLRYFSGIVSSGYFLDHATAIGENYYSGYMREMAKLHQTYLPKRCLNDLVVDHTNNINNITGNKTGEVKLIDPYRCHFAEYIVAAGLTTPILLINSVVDAWQLNNILIKGFSGFNIVREKYGESLAYCLRRPYDVQYCSSGDVSAQQSRNNVQTILDYANDWQTSIERAVAKADDKIKAESDSQSKIVIQNTNSLFPTSVIVDTCFAHCEADEAWSQILVPDPELKVTKRVSDLAPTMKNIPSDDLSIAKLITIKDAIRVWYDKVLLGTTVTQSQTDTNTVKSSRNSNNVKPAFFIKPCHLEPNYIPAADAWRIKQCNPSCLVDSAGVWQKNT